MRVATAFNKMLGLPGVTVTGVSFEPGGMVVALRCRRHKLVCPCGWKTWAGYDRRCRRWRHLDAGGTRVWLEAEVRRLECRRCGRVRTEMVSWARPGARHSRDFQDVVAWLAQHMDKTTITKLLRVSWEAVARIVVDVVADRLDAGRLGQLYRIGVDEISYRKGPRFLTVVADHDRRGAVVWAKEGKDANTLKAFYDELGADGRARLEAVSLDMGAAYKAASDAAVPHVAQCVDPFHVVKGANHALDLARRAEINRVRQRMRTEPHRGKGRPRNDAPKSARPQALWLREARWALIKDPDDLTDTQLDVLHVFRRNYSSIYRAWQLKEGMRDLYRLADPAQARFHLEWWLAWACRSRIPAFVAFSKTVRANRERILAAVELGLSNSKLEGLNSKIRLINHRGYGHHRPAAIIAMIYLCAGGVTVELPLR